MCSTLTESMSFLRWCKRKKRSNFSCMAATKALVKGAADAMLDFDLIDNRRRDLKLSKQQLADAIEVDQSTIWRWRNGMVPASDVVQRLADVLGLSMDEIYGRLHPAHRAALLVRGNPTGPPPSGPSTPPPPSGPKAGE
jgi:DNA-binding XRE family transcriptional regulator